MTLPLQETRKSRLLSRRNVLIGAGATAGLIGGSVWHQAILNERSETAWARQRQNIGRLPEIPQFDARVVGPVGHAKARLAQVSALRQACIGSLTPLANGLAKGLDSAAGRWLRQCKSPYSGELAEISGLIDEPGVYLLNSSYEWGCTALAAPSAKQDGAVLLRTLDWPFNGLGTYVELVRQSGPAGEFYNITWPGAVGVLSAMAPGRFAASINQAPARRHFKTQALDFLDSPLNVMDTYFNVDHPPAMHMLRLVFETARNFAEAKAMLERQPIANPAIFTLVGLEPDETCVIERDRQLFKTRTGIASAANDWRYSHFPGLWQPLGADDKEPRGDNPQRSSFIETFAAKALGEFDWVRSPVLNDYTRLAVEMTPKHGHVKLRGYEADLDGDLASPVTATLNFYA